MQSERDDDGDEYCTCDDIAASLDPDCSDEDDVPLASIQHMQQINMVSAKKKILSQGM